MYLKSESYGYQLSGKTVAHVMLKVNPLTMRLKAEVELTNGDTFTLKFNGESNDEFTELVHYQIRKRLE